MESDEEIDITHNYNLMRKTMLALALACLGTTMTYAQQSHVNIQYDPQRNTENIVPFCAQVISPEVNDDHTVIFRVKAPDAHEVLLSGSMFVGPDARKQVPFTKGDDGIWTLKIGPLTPEIYFYYISIDGVSNVDPSNTFTGHAAMPAFSMLFVHGDEPAWYDPKPEVPHGTITTHYYMSTVTGGLRDMMVYLPANYDPAKQYPCLYLMGGSGDLTETWVMHGRANWILDNMIYEGLAKEMIVCFPNDQMVTRTHPKHTELAFPLVEKELIECVVPFMESHYPVIRDRHSRALCGLSMGGRMTQYVGLRNLDVFANLGILSAAIDIDETPAVRQPDVNDKIDYLFVGGGTYETGMMARHVTLHEELDKLGVKHEFFVGGGGAHDLVSWRHMLYDSFLRNLWK